MKYEIKYDPKVEKQLEKFQKETAGRIVKKLSEVGETGRGIETISNEIYGFKIRIGDYRALIDITFNPNIIWVRYIDLRGRVYKRI